MLTKLFNINGIGLSKELGIFLFYFTQDSDTQTRTRKRMPVNNAFR